MSEKNIEESQARKKMMPLVQFLKKHGLKFKVAKVGQQSVQYFRYDDLQELYEKNKQAIHADKQIEELFDQCEDYLNFYSRPRNMPKLKYPKNLKYDENGKFASFIFQLSQKSHWKIVLLVLMGLIYLLFPLWPWDVKYAIFIVAKYLFFVIVAIALVRLALYILVSTMGYSFWLFPNFFDEVSPIDTVWPIYSIQKWDKSSLNIIFRLIAIAIFVYHTWIIYDDPSFIQVNIESTKQLMNDFHDWGVRKLNRTDDKPFGGRLDYFKMMELTADVQEQPL